MKVNLEKGYNGFMRYHDITKDDMLNGDGLRVVLWVAGCSHHCKGCQNPITWDPEGGVLFDESAKQEIFEQLDKPYIEGITFSGGDPLHEKNVDEVTAFAREIKEKYPKKNIWLYTGYLWEDIQDLRFLSGCDSRRQIRSGTQGCEPSMEGKPESAGDRCTKIQRSRSGSITRIRRKE